MTSAQPELERGTRRVIEATMRTTTGRAVAILVGELRDFDLAEEAVQDAWLDALRSWPRTGVPENPVGWIIATARRRAIDRLRQRQRGARVADAFGSDLLTRPVDDVEASLTDFDIPDERLALLFSCCHPALARDARVALTLRAVGGLTTREVARAFGVTEQAMQQRIVRTKQRIATAGIPYRVPEQHELADRLADVHSVIYAMFTEGYAATEHSDFIRVDLIREAARLAALVVELVPHDAESLGLHALILLHDARRAGRRDPAGSLVLLDDQDRDTWDREQIRTGVDLLDQAMAMRAPGAYQIQAAIAALHAEAPSVDETDWVQIAALFDELVRHWDSPTALLARAVAIGMADGADAGLRALETIEDRDDHRWHAAAGHMLESAGQRSDAAVAFTLAADLAGQPLEAERLRERAAATRP